MYSIGKVAKEFNLTVRTLRYYDEIDLLTPSRIADSGYRYYSKEDILVLQRVIALKKLGFQLEQVKSILNENDWEDIFEEQLIIIAKEKAHLDYLEKMLRLTQQLSFIEQDINWTNLFHYIGQTEEDQVKQMAYLKEFFSEKEREVFNNPLFHMGEKESMEIVYLLRIAREQKYENPSSMKSQTLARKLVLFLDEAFNGDKELIEKYWRLQKEAPEKGGLILVEENVIEYIDKIIDFYEANEFKNEE
ncbi:hypothetical protein BBI15_15885 [Planococcus plakortidis]|uniref:HTH merR-type domain-containing protein n=1 Tax=Planococcus plakortidis TaxID=1038856 RepID=A0A1C7EC51_9BACL|nr:MerR family transcriptional regulator [Planococcus plakortidis]ANU21554.1 hypothetical protein BBI15_15885 [Planococcus plakortidis]